MSEPKRPSGPKAFVREVLLPAEEELTSGANRGDLRDRVIAASSEAGFFTMTHPKTYSGAGVGALALTVVRETFAAANLRVASHVFAPGQQIRPPRLPRLGQQIRRPRRPRLIVLFESDW